MIIKDESSYLKLFKPGLPNQPVADDKLNAETSFLFFDLELTEQERNDFKAIEVINASKEQPTISYQNFNLPEKLKEEVAVFLASMGDNDLDLCNRIADLIFRLVEKIKKYFSQEAAWLCIRASIPNPAFVVPRWHLDGKYYLSSTEDNQKAAITLKGPNTLFFNATKEQKHKYLDIVRTYPIDLRRPPQEISIQMQKQQNEINKVFDISMAIQPEFGQGAIFLSGLQGAVHSEPNITEERIFLNILPGTAGQIKEWQIANQPSPAMKGL